MAYQKHPKKLKPRIQNRLENLLLEKNVLSQNRAD